MSRQVARWTSFTAPKRVISRMEHVARDGTYKIRRRALATLTGRGVVERIITDLAVTDLTRDGLHSWSAPGPAPFEESVQKRAGCRSSP